VDPFHVVMLATEALDDVRREVWNEARKQGNMQLARELKGARFAVWKNPENLTDRQAGKLASIQRTNVRLYRAYLLKEQLRQIYKLPAAAAIPLLDSWLKWARRSRLPAFVKLARTITAQRAGIVAAIEHGLSNARIEQINTQIRLITRRAFGFHSAEALIALAMLKLAHLCPPLPGRSHHPRKQHERPFWHALNPDDAAVPDMYKIARVLHAAEREGHVLPRGPKALWATEVSWNTKPPNPGGVPVEKQARWLEQAFYVLWRQGVDTVPWLQIRDEPPIPNYDSTYQGGLYYLNGEPKPRLTAYRFPFVTQRIKGSRVQAWGRAPQDGSVTIEELTRGQWKVVRQLSVGAQQVFMTTLTIPGRAVLRAQVGKQTSLTWTQGT
jgi:hypothetical protein